MASLCVCPLLPAYIFDHLAYFMHRQISLFLENASVLHGHSLIQPRSASWYDGIAPTFQHPRSLFMMHSWHLACNATFQGLPFFSRNVEKLRVAWARGYPYTNSSYIQHVWGGGGGDSQIFKWCFFCLTYYIGGESLREDKESGGWGGGGRCIIKLEI